MLGFTSLNFVLLCLLALHLGALGISVACFALALLLSAIAFALGPHEDRRAERAKRIEVLIHEKSRQIAHEPTPQK